MGTAQGSRGVESDDKRRAYAEYSARQGIENELLLAAREKLGARLRIAAVLEACGKPGLVKSIQPSEEETAKFLGG